jgi:hypothetical protein
MNDPFIENDDVDKCDRFISAFGADVLAKLGIQGLHVTDQWLAIHDTFGVVYLYITIDDGKDEDVQLMLDRVIYSPHDTDNVSMHRISDMLGISEEEAMQRLALSGCAGGSC